MKRYFLLLTIFCGMAMGLHAQPKNFKPIPMCGIKPGDPHTSAFQNEPGQFQGKLFTKLLDVPVREPHYWFLYLEDEEGRPLENAKIEVGGINIAARRGFATLPTVSNHLGYGHYLVRNVTYTVPGAWTMQFMVAHNSKTAVLTFDVVVGKKSEEEASVP